MEDPALAMERAEFWDSLTATERSILQAVESGRSTRAIAAELQTTPYRVQQSLARLQHRLT